MIYYDIIVAIYVLHPWNNSVCTCQNCIEFAFYPFSVMAWEAKIQELEKRLSEAAETRLFHDSFQTQNETELDRIDIHIQVDWGFELKLCSTVGK